MNVSTVETQWQNTAEKLAVPQDVKSKMELALLELEAHDRATADHCKRVGIWAVRIGQHLNLPQKPLFYGGSLHDLGKLAVPQSFLTKTTEWTPEDAAALRNHPLDGFDKAVEEGLIVTAGLIVRHHTFQPNRYPDQLPPPPPYMRETFDRCARTIALADYYDASHRPNSAGLATGEEIKAKVLDHNHDLRDVVEELYATGIFSTEGVY